MDWRQRRRQRTSSRWRLSLRLSGRRWCRRRWWYGWRRRGRWVCLHDRRRRDEDDLNRRWRQSVPDGSVRKNLRHVSQLHRHCQYSRSRGDGRVERGRIASVNKVEEMTKSKLKRSKQPYFKQVTHTLNWVKGDRNFWIMRQIKCNSITVAYLNWKWVQNIKVLNPSQFGADLVSLAKTKL